MVKIKCPAKVNLSLKIISKRQDGYHELEMTLVPVNIFDELSLNISNKKDITVNSTPYGPQGKDNLIYKCAKYFFEKSKISSGVHVEVKKNIPSGAGLGGGSSNGASCIKALEKLFQTSIYPYNYNEIAFKLGADIPFFLEGKNAFVEGIGERVTPLKLMKKLYFIIIFPGFTFSTPKIYEAYDNIKLTALSSNGISSAVWLKDLFEPCIDTYLMRNDLQRTGVLMNSNISTYFEFLRLNNTEHMMSGSGSSVFGIYQSLEERNSTFKKLQNKINATNNNNVRLFMAETTV